MRKKQKGYGCSTPLLSGVLFYMIIVSEHDDEWMCGKQYYLIRAILTRWILLLRWGRCDRPEESAYALSHISPQNTHAQVSFFKRHMTRVRSWDKMQPTHTHAPRERPHAFSNYSCAAMLPPRIFSWKENSGYRFLRRETHPFTSQKVSRRVAFRRKHSQRFSVYACASSRVCAYVRVCVLVYVYLRSILLFVLVCACVCICVYLCACVWVREHQSLIFITSEEQYHHTYTENCCVSMRGASVTHLPQCTQPGWSSAFARKNNIRIFTTSLEQNIHSHRHRKLLREHARRLGHALAAVHTAGMIKCLCTLVIHSHTSGAYVIQHLTKRHSIRIQAASPLFVFLSWESDYPLLLSGDCYR